MQGGNLKQNKKNKSLIFKKSFKLKKNIYSKKSEGKLIKFHNTKYSICINSCISAKNSVYIANKEIQFNLK